MEIPRPTGMVKKAKFDLYKNDKHNRSVKWKDNTLRKTVGKADSLKQDTFMTDVMYFLLLMNDIRIPIQQYLVQLLFSLAQELERQYENRIQSEQ